LRHGKPRGTEQTGCGKCDTHRLSLASITANGWSSHRVPSKNPHAHADLRSRAPSHGFHQLQASYVSPAASLLRHAGYDVSNRSKGVESRWKKA
jgi:hypothetical protein